MPVPTDITAGTISISGSTVTGVGTSFVASDIRQGDLFIWIEGGAGQWSPIVQTVTSNTVLTLAEPWTGPTISGARYRLRYQWDSSRVSAQSRQLIEMLDNGNVLALAGLTGPGVPVFDGPHSMTVQPVSDFINGVAYNVQVDTLADRAAYDGQAAGFAVLVSDVGDGRSAVYSKASNTSGDWTDPAYVTGPIGGTPDIAAGTTTTLPPGSDATFDVTPDGSGGYLLSAGIPAGRGFTNRGAYDSGTAYVVDDVVTFAGSTFIAIQAVPSGNPPSSAMPPVDNAYWSVLAARGANGAGTVSSVAAGSGIAVDPSDPTSPSVSLANVPTATIKGRVAGGTGAPTDLTGTQVNTILPIFGTAKGLVPGRTSAMGLFLRDDGTWQPAGSEDLEFTVAQMMMRLADIDNVAQFLGPNGNRFADSYDTLTYVDVAGATNLDTSTGGVLKPTSVVTGGIDSFVDLMLHGDGPDGSTSIVDSSLTPATVTASGGVEIDTAQFKFGGSSILFNGTGAYLAVPDADITEFGSGNFTIDFWMRTTTVAAGTASLLSKRPDISTVAPIELNRSGAALALLMSSNVANGWDIAVNTSPNVFTANTWHHIAVVRNGTNIRVYVDGVSVISVTSSLSTINNAAAYQIGRAINGSQLFSGWLDEYRISVGVARWTSNFTPPTSAYTGASTTDNLAVRSTSFSAPSAPTKMKSLLNVREVEPATAGTDYFIDVSRDGGTTWSAMTLTERYSLPSGLRVVEGAEIDVSGQPSGTAPRYRLRTANNKNVEFHDTYLYWS